MDGILVENYQSKPVTTKPFLIVTNLTALEASPYFLDEPYYTPLSELP